MHLLYLAAAATENSTRVVVPSVDEMIWGGIAFLIVFVALWRFVFPRLRATLDAREQAIRSELERAEQARLEAEQRREEYERRLASARQEADRVVAEATAAAENLRRERLANAED